MNPDSCAICLADTAPADSIVLHTHSARCHRDCLHTWLEANASCPLCREPLCRHAAVCITAAEAAILKRYILALQYMHTREVELRTARDADIATLTDHRYILAVKSGYMTKSNSLYLSHELIYESLEAQLREVQTERALTMDDLRIVYEARVQAGIAV